MPSHNPKTKKKLGEPKTKVKSVEEAQAKGTNNEWVFRAIDMMKKGFTHTQIKEVILQNKHGVKTLASVTAILGEANKILTAEYCTERKHVESLHVKRYNETINKLLDIKEENFKDKVEGRQMQMEAYMNVLSTMFQKEKLLQFHNKNFKIEINNTTNININKKKGPRLDVSRLTFEEQLELYELMQKSKITEDEALGVTDGDEVAEHVVTEDIVAEVINEEPNINKITTISKGIPEDKPAIVTVHDPIAKLKETLRKRAVEEFQKKNANLDQHELQQLSQAKADRK